MIVLGLSGPEAMKEPEAMSDAAEKCPNRETNLQTCACAVEDCPRRGMCCECIAAHRDKGDLPACVR